MRAAAIVLLGAIASFGQGTITPPVEDEDEGLEGVIRLKIPEPLVFDLVRPLGATPGETEVNTLARLDLRTGKIKWNPEIEAVVLPWLALEFELPIENATLTTYKFAAQGGLKGIGGKRSPYSHGWQTIYELGRQEFPSDFSALYITGVRWSPTISSLSLNGWQTIWGSTPREHAALVNNTIFWQRPNKPVLGFETNFRLRPESTSALLMPQIHFQLPRRWSLQVGMGAARADTSAWAPNVAARLIWELN